MPCHADMLMLLPMKYHMLRHAEHMLMLSGICTQAVTSLCRMRQVVGKQRCKEWLPSTGMCMQMTDPARVGTTACLARRSSSRAPLYFDLPGRCGQQMHSPPPRPGRVHAARAGRCGTGPSYTQEQCHPKSLHLHAPQMIWQVPENNSCVHMASGKQERLAIAPFQQSQRNPAG